ncbi:MAG: hypothetical protein JOY62_05855 [Acidobacteriaceae bacterium]|nr:hypothetical protein [Acidobacteriaceae bacterium]MBV9779483.1 hypothetical protein [Acidobacteriaceae bacterium]
MLSGLNMLDIAIGLCLVYLVLSFICSSVVEGLESILKNRSRLLERGVRALLQDEEDGSITRLIYNHPIISSLYPGAYRPPGKMLQKTNLPSYIPATNFALVLLDVMIPGTADTPGGAAGALGRFARDLDPAELYSRLRTAAANFPSSRLRPALLALIDASGGDVNRFRESIEGWYNNAMDRVSGWYKRRAQFIIFFVGLAVTATLNVDTVEIVNRLATDPAVRSSLVATAQEYAKSSGAQADPRVKENVKQLESLGLPIGWQRAPSGYFWFVKVAGILASALAATLGAPFWFDLLNRFIVVRSTVKPQEKSRPEKSKD